jgi:chromosome segregation ATPase
MTTSKYSEEEEHIEYLKRKEEKLKKLDYLIIKLENIELLIKELKEHIKP